MQFLFKCLIVGLQEYHFKTVSVALVNRNLAMVIKNRNFGIFHKKILICVLVIIFLGLLKWTSTSIIILHRR